tara:strand:- start:105 stop:299 length:195 start_codon:yes stop_codon:yes gene_type:complete
MISQVNRGMSHQLKMMSISLKKTNKKLDTLIDLMANGGDIEKTTDDEGECSVCGTTAPRIYLNV